MRMIRICFGLILLLAASGRMLGQAGETGSILGTITDGAGEVVQWLRLSARHGGQHLPNPASLR